MAFEDFDFLNQEPDFANRPEHATSVVASPVRIGPARGEIFFPAQQFAFLRHSYVLFTMAEQREFLRIYYACAGRHAALWVPTWRRDLIVTAGLEDGSTELTIDSSTEFHDVWNPAVQGDPGKYIFIRSRENGLLTRQVTGHTDSTVTLASALTWTDSRAVVGFVLLCRFDDDTLVLKAIAPGKARVDCRFKQVLDPT